MSDLDRYDIRKITERRTQAPNTISVGVTWVDGRILFFKTKEFFRRGHAWYGVCHYSNRIYAITPLDFKEPTMVTTILVAPPEHYCDKAFSCLNFKCPFNRFSRDMFENDFKGMKSFTLGLPQNLGSEDLWFNLGKWATMWEKLKLTPNGGQLKFDENKAKEM